MKVILITINYNQNNDLIQIANILKKDWIKRHICYFIYEHEIASLRQAHRHFIDNDYQIFERVFRNQLYDLRDLCILKSINLGQAIISNENIIQNKIQNKLNEELLVLPKMLSKSESFMNKDFFYLNPILIDKIKEMIVKEYGE